MKYRLPLIFICLLLSLISLEVQAQGIEYAYDQAGNRIGRQVIVLHTTRSAPSEQEPMPAANTQIAGWKVVVYPNPTQGMLSLHLSVLEPVEGESGQAAEEAAQKATATLYSLDGRPLLKRECPPGETLIDMTAFPVGHYLMKLVAGDETKEFKIIRE